MRSWKTTLTALLSAAASFILFGQSIHYIEFPQWAMAIALFAHVGGLASLGIYAKDYNVTGTNAPPSSDVATK